MWRGPELPWQFLQKLEIRVTKKLEIREVCESISFVSRDVINPSGEVIADDIAMAHLV